MFSMTGELHAKAMELAELADVARIRKDEHRYQALILQAYDLEVQAAETLLNSDFEPTRSVLYRSAASLAVESRLFREAEILVAKGLSGNTPDEIAQELRAILEDIHFQFNLKAKGLKLERRDISLAISGKETGYGIAPSDLVLDRLQNVRTIIHRTVERMRNQSYREGGAGAAANEYPIYLKAPSAGSFEVTLSIGEPQIPLPGLVDPVEDIIKEIFVCADMVNNAEFDELKQHIPDEAYYNNFVSQMKKIAPDGELVAAVKFSAIQDGDVKSLVLNRRRQEISAIMQKDTKEEKEIEGEIYQARGKLRFADGLSDEEKGTIKLKRTEGKTLSFVVPQGMDDIVAQHWSKQVLVTYTKSGKKLYLQDVDIDRTTE